MSVGRAGTRRPNREVRRRGYASNDAPGTDGQDGADGGGWGLDPACADEAARAAAAARDGVRLLQPLMQMAISAHPAEEPNLITEGRMR